MPTYSIPVHPDHLRSITDPNDPSMRTIYALINVFDLPDLSLSPDPRVPKPSKITQRIATSLGAWDGRFHVLNRGIVVSAQSAEYDSADRILSLDIPDDDDSYGVLDGGHTKFSIDSVVRDTPREKVGDGLTQYVRLEILLGVRDVLGRIASARNFSEDVKAISLANYEKKLDWLKKAVGEYASAIRWSENDEGKMDALELIQILTAVNPALFKNGDHPVEAYKNTGKCLDYIIDPTDKHSYKKFASVARSVWHLYDVIRFDWWRLYQAPAPDTGKRGRPGRLAEVAARKRGHRNLMHYVTLGKDGDPEKGDKHVEKGLAIPLLAGFRILLAEGRDGSYEWLDDPVAFFKRYGQLLVRRVMELSDQRQNNPNAVGRDKMVYQTIYELVELLRLRERASEQEAAKQPSRRAVPGGA